MAGKDSLLSKEDLNINKITGEQSMETVLEPLKVAIREETLRTMTHSFDLPSVNLDFDPRHTTSMKWEKHKDPYFFLLSCTSHIFHFTHYQANIWHKLVRLVGEIVVWLNFWGKLMVQIVN